MEGLEVGNFWFVYVGEFFFDDLLELYQVNQEKFLSFLIVSDFKIFIQERSYGSDEFERSLNFIKQLEVFLGKDFQECVIFRIYISFQLVDNKFFF